MSLSNLKPSKSFNLSIILRMKSKLFSTAWEALQVQPLNTLVPVLTLTHSTVATMTFLLPLKHSKNILASGPLHQLYPLMAWDYIVYLFKLLPWPLDWKLSEDRHGEQCLAHPMCGWVLTLFLLPPQLHLLPNAPQLELPLASFLLWFLPAQTVLWWVVWAFSCSLSGQRKLFSRKS